MEPILDEVLGEMDRCLGWIESSLARLNDDTLWKRPRPEMNSVANLCLHLAGNERHYIGHGVGGLKDTRDRANEFNASGGIGAEGLLGHLNEARGTTRAVFEKLRISDFGRRISTDIPGARNLLQTLFHVSHHYSLHSGQIVLLTKLYQEGTERILEWGH
jgi:uncharacterized damage-inducible protein DinB